jgi:hypothetical protein
LVKAKVVVTFSPSLIVPKSWEVLSKDSMGVPTLLCDDVETAVLFSLTFLAALSLQAVKLKAVIIKKLNKIFFICTLILVAQK